MSTPEFREQRTKYPHGYVLDVQQSDGGWLVFTAQERLWGLPWQERLAPLGGLSHGCRPASCRRSQRVSWSVRSGSLPRRYVFSAPILKPRQWRGTGGKRGPRELASVITSFNEMQAQIQKFVAYRTAMLAAISHDLRTPLTRIRLRGELIEDEVQQARLFRDVEELQAMIDGALAFFRGDADEEAVTSFDLPVVLQTIANDYADQTSKLPM